MYKFVSRPKNQGSSYLAILGLASVVYLGMVTVSPQKTENIDSRVFVEGVTIHLNHNSPPVAALEDILISDEMGDERIPANVPKTPLASGSVSMRDLAEKMIVANESARPPLQENIANAGVRQNTDANAGIRQNTIPQTQARVQNIDLKSVGVTREELLDALFIPVMNNNPSSINRGGRMPTPAQQVSRRMASANVPPTVLPVEGTNLAPKMNRALASEVGEQGFAPNSDPARQIMLRGAVEMSQGLAFTAPTDRIVVFREDKGQQFEVGNVWTKEGRFEIGVSSTNGLLVAELRTQAGEVLGSGRATMDTPRILISLAPTTQGLVGRVIAANSSDSIETHPIKSAKMMVDMIPHEFISEAGGRFSDPNLVNQSTMILKTEKAGFLPGLSIVSAGDDNLIPMYSNKMVTELLSLQSNSDQVNNPDGEQAAPADLKNLAIVWGRVTKNGEAVAGGQVEMLTADRNVRAVYFNKMMIPDLSLTSTSSNGYYAFVGVNPGVQAVQVTYQSLLSEPSVIPADANSISQMNIDVARSKEANAIVFDAFHTEKPLQSQILKAGQSSGQETDVHGQAKIRYAEGTGLMILDVDAGEEYEMMRLTLSRNKNTIYAPVVTQTWFENLRKSAGLDEIAYTGSIMGFIQADRPYKATFGDKVDGLKVVYFNAHGEILSGDVGEPGGGFVIFNAPEGLSTVSVTLQGSEKILTQTQYVERNIVSAFSHWFH